MVTKHIMTSESHQVTEGKNEAISIIYLLINFSPCQITTHNLVQIYSRKFTICWNFFFLFNSFIGGDAFRICLFLVLIILQVLSPKTSN